MSRKDHKKISAQCPECDSWVGLKPPLTEGDLVVCPVCNTELEVVGLNPPELDYTDGVWYGDEQDIDDEYEDDFDDDEDFEEEEAWEEDDEEDAF